MHLLESFSGNLCNIDYQRICTPVLFPHGKQKVHFSSFGYLLGEYKIWAFALQALLSGGRLLFLWVPWHSEIEIFIHLWQFTREITLPENKND